MTYPQRLVSGAGRAAVGFFLPSFSHPSSIANLGEKLIMARAMDAMMMPRDDSDSARFSFTAPSCAACSHSNGSDCITTPAPADENVNEDENENETETENDDEKHTVYSHPHRQPYPYPEKHHQHPVYPSPPPTASQPPLPLPLPQQQQREQQQYFGGILDSPVVLVRAPVPAPALNLALPLGVVGAGLATPLSPPPTIPTPTHALPPADSLLQPILEHEGGAHEHEGHEAEAEAEAEAQLLSPISPEWATHRKPPPADDDAAGEEEDSVLMAQPRYRTAFGLGDAFGPPHADDDVLGFGRPALRPLDIPVYHHAHGHAREHAHDHEHEHGRERGREADTLPMQPFLGFPGAQLIDEDVGEMYADPAPLGFAGFGGGAPAGPAYHGETMYHHGETAYPTYHGHDGETTYHDHHHEHGADTMQMQMQPAFMGFPGAQLVDDDEHGKMYDDEMYDGAPGVLLGFPGAQRIEEHEDFHARAYRHQHTSARATSPLSAMTTSGPSSPASSLRDFEPLDDLDLYSSDSDVDVDMADGDGDGDEYGYGYGGMGMDMHASSPLRSFASLPSPDLDDLDLDLEMMAPPPPSPARRGSAALPPSSSSSAFFPFPSSSHSNFDDATDAIDTPFSFSAPSPFPAEPPTAPLYANANPAPGTPNALLLDLPLPAAKPPAPSILDALAPAQLRAPVGLPQAELDALLAVRRRASAALVQAMEDSSSASNSSSSPSGSQLEYELRRTVPRDAGEPRRRRKRAKELGREVDALVGLALGILPPRTAEASASSSIEAEVGGSDEKGKEKEKERKRGEKAGLALAGLASVPALVARMILRRRERCVRGLGEGRARGGRGVESPLRRCMGLEEEDAPLREMGAMEVQGAGEEGGEPPPTPVSAPMDLDLAA
ncbi:hypothetical protein DFH09DRAFT_1066913 [Mycena vulgaris]|nr:hypothetical protein DFH09DRAFT_1066913 [Mycena vulgaris]